jgi:exodeoxyribonuclease V alpha subunit
MGDRSDEEDDMTDAFSREAWRQRALKVLKALPDAEQLELLELAAPSMPAYDASSDELELDNEQADAAYLLCNAPIGIITGGPGRGKTRTLQAALPHMGKSVALCAPSGKAARRMAELTGHPAGTVHRLLGLQPDREACTYYRGNPLPFDVVVVDEASTLDNALCARLLDACDVARTRVFFIGDVDQLPSVGPGQVLQDLIESGAVPVVRLVTMHRSAAESWICRMAPEILEGRIDLTQCPDFIHYECDETLVTSTVTIAKALVEQHGRDEVQVVVPMNVGDVGATVLNPALQAAINPGYGASFSAGKAKIRAGDSVVVISNDYDRSVFNGETGRVLTIDEGEGGVVVDFIDREISYTKTEAAEFLRLSYALSVHKMQGSEVGWLVLAIHEKHGPLLSRKLLYTAVTRAKRGVVIVGQRSAILRAVQVEDTTRRITTLRERIESLQAEP